MNFTKQQTKDIEALLWNHLPKGKNNSDHRITGWGEKSLCGLCSCLKTIIEQEANTQLIAMGPELLATLKHALHFMETPGGYASHEHTELLDDIENCIAKAEGKENQS